MKFLAKVNRPALAEQFHSLALYALCVFWVTLAFSSALVEIFSVTAFVAWIFWKRLSGRPFWTLSRELSVPLLLFLLAALVSVVFSEYPSKSFRGILKVLQQLMLFVVAADLFSADIKKRFFEIIVLGAAALVLSDAIFQYFAGFDFLRFHAPEASGAGVRLSAGFGNYGKLAAYLVCVIPFLGGLALFYRERKMPKHSLVSLALLLGLAAVLFLTRSRGAFLGLLAGLFLAGLFLRKFKLLFVLLFAAGIGAALLPHNMMIHLDADRKEQSVVERYYLWDRAIHVIKAKPLTGTGINTYAVAHQKYDSTGNWRVKNYYAHNGYLQIAAEMGLPALFCLLWFFAVYFFRAFTAIGKGTENPKAGLLSGLLSFLIFAAVDTLLHSSQPAMMLWFLLGLQEAYRCGREN